MAAAASVSRIALKASQNAAHRESGGAYCWLGRDLRRDLDLALLPGPLSGGESWRQGIKLLVAQRTVN